ncbi:MAG TPA: twitch domain-containing radical SAM protein [Chitinophagales bacterium]|nr:twitch domain-containing radical SAM protein [Chitinophagales bacterium]
MLKYLRWFPRIILPKSIIHLQKSKVFCMSPWLQLNAQVNGFVLPCCMSTIDNATKLSDLNENADLNVAWNSEKMKELRLAMLSEKKNSLCNNCYKYEALGKESERMKYNRDYENRFDRVLRTQKDGSLKDEKILILDMRFSNKCNYKCRICSSECSSLWYEEERRLGLESVQTSPKKKFIPSNIQSFSQPFFSSLDGIEKIHFAGGEPLVMDEHYQVLEYLIENKRFDVEISYNSNFSTLKYKNWKVIDLWSQFSKVQVWASLDGMGEKGDYMRKGQQWNKIEENFRIVEQNCPKVMVGVNVTVSLLNIFHLPEFISHLINNNFVHQDNINLYLLFGPEYFNLTHLPIEVKAEAEKVLNNFKEGYLQTIQQPDNINKHIDVIINYMNSKQGDQLPITKDWLIKIDKLRNEDFVKTFPELSFINEVN